MNSRTVILGAGITGIACAYFLSKNRSGNYTVLEKDSRPGGICKSEFIDDFTFDYTGHLIHLRNPEIEKLIKSLLADNILKHQRKAWIYSSGVYTPYPFQANTYGLPKNIVRECVTGFIDAKIKHPAYSGSTGNISFYDWVIRQFGNGIAKYFMVPYNRKLWRIHPRYLTCDWINTLVPQPKIIDVLKGALGGQNTAFGYNTCFYYPKYGGIQSLIDALLERVPDNNILFNTSITRIYPDKKTLEFRIPGCKQQKISYRHLVASIPIPELIKLIDRPPEEIISATNQLRCNSVLCINLGFESTAESRIHISDKHWVYFPEDRYSFYRVGYYRNFSKYLCPENTDSLYAEVSYRSAERIDFQKTAGKVINQLMEIGILSAKQKLMVVNLIPMPYAYVVYDFQRNKNLEIIGKYLAGKNIFTAGRFGAWEYSAMEESIIEGKTIANKLV